MKHKKLKTAAYCVMKKSEKVKLSKILFLNGPQNAELKIFLDLR